MKSLVNVRSFVIEREICHSGCFCQAYGSAPTGCDVASAKRLCVALSGLPVYLSLLRAARPWAFVRRQTIVPEIAPYKRPGIFAIPEQVREKLSNRCAKKRKKAA